MRPASPHWIATAALAIAAAACGNNENDGSNATLDTGTQPPIDSSSSQGNPTASESETGGEGGGSTAGAEASDTEGMPPAGETSDTDAGPPDGALCQPENAPEITQGCIEESEGDLVFPCGEDLTLLIVAAYESDLATPDATKEQVEAYANSEGFEGRWSVAERVRQLTGDRVALRFQVEMVQVPRPLSYYEDGNSLDFHIDALQELQADGFDFSQLAQGPEGRFLPFLTISVGDFFRTPHAGFYLEVDGRQFEGYSLTYYEPGYEVGVMVHELGHSLFRWGEYYDWDDGTTNAGVGAWGPMGTGFESAYNPFIRQCKGWNITFDIADDRYPIGTAFEVPANANVVVRYRTAARPSEYFLIEAVQRDEAYPDLPDEGLLIWHIDENMEREQAGLGAAVHNKVALEQADGLFGMETEPFDEGGEGDAFRAGYREEFGETTMPSSTWWDGTASGLEISEISDVGSSMRFILGPPGTEQVGETVVIADCGLSTCE